jgi:uncharacterized protein
MRETEKYISLVHSLEKSEKIAVAFSGGVDSTFLIAVAKRILHQNVIALTVKTPYIPDWEIEEAMEFCKTGNITHRVIHADIIPDILNNPVNRCYICKKYLFSRLKEEAAIMGFENIADGTNADDEGVYRPGLKALHELKIKSPLLEAGFTKMDIRKHSKKLGLPTAAKPAYACLLTRFPYNYNVNTEELDRVEKAEKFIISLGFPGSRVRNHGDLARIEAPKKHLSQLIESDTSLEIINYFHELGYRNITIDLEGYRTGSFDT